MNHADVGTRSQTLVILGATGAVGSSLSRRLKGAGHDVFLAGRNPQVLRDLSEELAAPALELDVLEPGSIERTIQSACETFDHIDGVVNCIGSVLLKPAHLTGDEEWSEVLAVNLTSAFETVRSAAKVLGRQGGSVVLISSAAARVGLANHEAIAAAKAGVIGLTLSAAASYAGRGIRVNAVAPGLVKSKMTRHLWESEAAESMSSSMHALNRLGEPEQVASMIEWLLHPANDWVTGQVFGVDGGLATVIPRSRQKSG
ncbi:SDR family NAD(P)-dependent oxidoreductase [Gimesia sp.]|uniref:SDR family NAD(P)-dependent oxidoreductase n=1 Tax=Gimesia sp. TaxID=2024833 RepID=UPI003A942EC5